MITDHETRMWNVERDGRYMTVLGGYKLDMENGGRLVRETIKPKADGDYGCDPLGDNKFRMVPSGDVVDITEMRRRLQS